MVVAETVDVNIPVDAEAAVRLATAGEREAIGRVVSRMLRPRKGDDSLLAAMDRLAIEAERRGLTQEILDQELAAYNAERRDRPAVKV